MWSEREADAPVCPGGGTVAAAAPTLPDGFPFGAGLCPSCGDFVALIEGRLRSHDAYRGAADATKAAHRGAWFNAHGWQS